MTIYAIALFLHIVGALGVFVALGLEWMSIYQLRCITTAEQVQEWLPIAAGMRWVGMPSMLLAIATGVYMMSTVWGMAPWISVALVALVLLIVVAMAVTRPRRAAIVQAVTTERGPLSPTLRQRLQDPVLWASIQTRAAIALAIIFLMAVKPGLEGALLTLGVAIILGLAASWPRGSFNQANQPAA
ncbi:MAG: hypothetical protein DYG89_24795 [Caldilinea sp. CFX5]|nr:hypothetical protein [Caldilinea sp. CFX5]